MAITTRVKTFLNSALRPLNVKLDSLTVDRLETERLSTHAQDFGFDDPLYALTPAFHAWRPDTILGARETFANDLAKLLDPARNAVAYDPSNDFFGPSDAAASYLLLRTLQPGRIVEIGCGNSTRVARQAILDGVFDCELTAIDPHPRADIEQYVDRFERRRLETTPSSEIFADLSSGDVIFIDSSHEARAGGDVAHLFCRLIPAAPPGVIVHVHDVFLPYEYPRDMFFAYSQWGEQYVLHALLQGGGQDILWPGYFAQRQHAEAIAVAPELTASRAQSFWFRKTS